MCDNDTDTGQGLNCVCLFLIEEAYSNRLQMREVRPNPFLLDNVQDIVQEIIQEIVQEIVQEIL